jgi:hypothetical protein
VFESGDDVLTIAAQRAMIAVVKQDNVAAPSLAGSDPREPGDQSLSRLGHPIPAFSRPHDDPLHSGAPNFLIQ